MGYCFLHEDKGKFPKCDGRLNASEHPELPCGGMGGGDDQRTITCSSYCRTIKEAKEVLADWKKQHWGIWAEEEELE